MNYTMIDMEIITVGIYILQSIAISLGVGTSTIAIVNFFVAIADGKIDETERRMMGIGYILLRIAMVLILVTTVSLLALEMTQFGLTVFTTYVIAQLILIGVLFINAYLMTRRIMPSTFGPAIQAGSWYTLGIIAALVPLGLTNFSLLQFSLIYFAILLLGIILVNGMMAYLKSTS